MRLLILVLLLIGCSTPEPAATSLQPCKREHLLQDLKIQLHCDWQLERSTVSDHPIHRLIDRNNKVLLQTGKIWNTSAPYDADSSLNASFSERKIQGKIFAEGDVTFIYGSRSLRNRSGDSLFIYLEDTSRWNYYHFDGEFQDPAKLQEFIEAVKMAELVGR